MATGLAFVHLNFFAHIEVMLLTHLVEMIDQSSARMVEIIDCLMLRLCLQCVTAQGISFRSLYWTSPESGGTYIATCRKTIHYVDCLRGSLLPNAIVRGGVVMVPHLWLHQIPRYTVPGKNSGTRASGKRLAVSRQKVQKNQKATLNGSPSISCRHYLPS
jgi:hypothetical protein